MDTDIETTDEGSSVKSRSRAPSDWSAAPIFHPTTKHSLAEFASSIISRIHLHDPVVEVPMPGEIKYIIQPMFATKTEDHPDLLSVRHARELPNLLKRYPTNIQTPRKALKQKSMAQHAAGRPSTSRFQNVDEMPKPDVPIAESAPFQLRWVTPSNSGSPDAPDEEMESEDGDESDREEEAEDADSENYSPGVRRQPARKARKGAHALVPPNPFREKEGKYHPRSYNIRFADVPGHERQSAREQVSFAVRKAAAGAAAAAAAGLKVTPVGGNIARVVMCGFMKHGDPTMSCGIYTTKTYDLIRHRVAHLYYECLMCELGETPPGGGLVFGGFKVELPTCAKCGKTFTRYDSLQRHGKRTDTACFAPNRERYEKENREQKETVVRRELEKNVGMQYWIKTPTQLPKTVKAKVGIRNGGGPGLGSCVLEILKVEETYAPRYEFTTVKDGKELQVRLLDHNEKGGIPFYRPLKGSYDPNPEGKGLVLP